MTTEDKLKQCIIENYGTINDFCYSIGMPKSTISTIFKRGVMSCSISTMFKICDGLGIDIQALSDGEIVYTTVQRNTNLFDFQIFIKELEISENVFAYKQRVLSKKEREKIAFVLKLALEQL